MIPVAVCTGMRRGELIALQWADVDLAGRSIHVRHRGDFRTKGNAERRVPIRGDAEHVLGEMHEPDLSGSVFTDREGEPIRPDRVSHRFKHMVRKAGLDERIHFHSLRHTTGRAPVPSSGRRNTTEVQCTPVRSSRSSVCVSWRMSSAKARDRVRSSAVEVA